MTCDQFLSPRVNKVELFIFRRCRAGRRPFTHALIFKFKQNRFFCYRDSGCACRLCIAADMVCILEYSRYQI